MDTLQFYVLYDSAPQWMRISKTTSRVLREDLHQPDEQEEQLESGWWRGSCLPCWLSSSQALKHSDSRPSSQALKLASSSSESPACHAGSAHTGRQVRPPILSPSRLLLSFHPFLHLFPLSLLLLFLCFLLLLLLSLFLLLTLFLHCFFFPSTLHFPLPYFSLFLLGPLYFWQCLKRAVGHPLKQCTVR